MKRYVALLRGININGKNKVPMAELKSLFEAHSFENVKTVLNSGNVLFSCSETDTQTLTKQIADALKERFGFEVPVFVIESEALEDILRHAPAWWGTEDKAVYDNLIFILPPATVAEVYEALGEPKAGPEQAQAYKNAVFWSFSRKDYQKTNWWSKTASLPIGQKLTIRTAGTLRKCVATEQNGNK